MYSLSKKQLKSLASFVDSLDDSMIKSHINSAISDVVDKESVTDEVLQKFVSFSTHLPLDKQNYPMEFSNAVRKGEELAVPEKEVPKEAKNKPLKKLNK